MGGPDATHDPGLKSWVESANDPASDFPIQNLPFGVFRRKGTKEKPRGGVAIGDQIFDLAALGIETGPTLNGIAAAGASTWRRLRKQISKALSVGGFRKSYSKHVVPMKRAELFVPMAIADYTDFYSGIYHATTIGKLFRPDNPLLPNYKWVPIGYHGRASSVVVSGTPVVRPAGQVKPPDSEAPVFGWTKRLDYEVELGFVVGTGNRLGAPIGIMDARERLFGVVLLNDWSARDVQAWEYQPLGPFLAKSFATSISPWVVTMEALEPFRTPAFARPAGDPAPLPHLSSPRQASHGGVDLTLQVLIATKKMREQKVAPLELCRSNLRDLYWTPGQLLAHHTSNGCNLRPGDLLGSGTVSGESKESRGCLLERTWRGSEPLSLPGGETRRFLEDGDEVILRGFCERQGLVRIGLGECRGVIEAATA
jgi:fumarylacetoacetase